MKVYSEFNIKDFRSNDIYQFQNNEKEFDCSYAIYGLIDWYARNIIYKDKFKFYDKMKVNWIIDLYKSNYINISVLSCMYSIDLWED